MKFSSTVLLKINLNCPNTIASLDAVSHATGQSYLCDVDILLSLLASS